MIKENEYSSKHGHYRFVEDISEADGPVTLFLHAGPGYNTIAERKYLAPMMTGSFNMIWVDQLGCHNSPAASVDSITLENTLQDLADILKPYAERRINLIGFCVSTQIVHYFVERFPKLFKDIVLVGPTLNTGDVFKNLLQQHLDLGNIQAGFDNEADLKKLMDVPGDQYGIEQLQAFGNVVQKNPQWNDLYWNNKVAMGEYYAACSENVLNVDVFFRIQKELFQKTIPNLRSLYSDRNVLLVQGEYDKVVPWESNGKKIVEAIPHARVEFVPNTGHWVYFEERDYFIELLKDFLN